MNPTTKIQIAGTAGGILFILLAGFGYDIIGTASGLLAILLIHLIKSKYNTP